VHCHHNFVRSQPITAPLTAWPSRNPRRYTEAVMKAWSRRTSSWGIEGLPLHFYSAGPGGIVSAPSTGFGEAEYAYLL
jgi:hypothetical protein